MLTMKTMTSRSNQSTDRSDRASTSTIEEESAKQNAIANRPHLDVDVWLKTLELTQYRSNFENKFDGVEDLLNLNSRDILDLGVKNGAHRTRLLSSLTILRDKYNKALLNTTKSFDSNMNRLIEFNINNNNDFNYNLSSNGTLEFKRKRLPSTVDNCNNNNTLASPSALARPGSTDDIKDHCWYHGSLSRAKAESMVLYSGQFLVRDCISQPGNYVLTCNWDGRPVNFMINRMVLNRKATYERIVYQFEDEQYASVPALIRAYVSERKSVTQDSMCTINEPVNRSKAPENEKDGDGDVVDAVQNFNYEIKSLENPDYATYMKFASQRQPQQQKTSSVAMNNNKMATAAATTDVVKNGLKNGNSINNVAIIANNGAKFEGIDNLPIPSTSATIRSRPLPPLPLANRLQETERRLNHKWNSESALEKSCSTTSSGTFVANNNNKNGNKIRYFGSAKNLLHTNNSNSNTSSPIRIVPIVFEDDQPSVPPAVPPKPKRAPSLKRGNTPAVIVRNKRGGFKEIAEIDDEDDYHEYCDIDYEDVNASVGGFASERPDSGLPKSPETTGGFYSPSTSHSRITPPPLPPRTIVATDRDSACVPDFSVYDRPNPLCPPIVARAFIAPSRIDLQRFPLSSSPNEAQLLPSDVKPLDVRVWPEVKDLILGISSYRLAAGITKEDCNFLDIFLNASGVNKCATTNYGLDDGVVATSGLLSLILPQGEQLRLDILERSRCWQFFIVSTLVKAESVNERTEILAKWIDVARELKDTYKNLYGFGNVISALSSAHVSHLSKCWRRLRTDFTDLAVTYETQLRSDYAQIQKCDSSCFDWISDVCIPDVEPLARLLSIKQADLSWLYEWEDLDEEFGLDAFWIRLSTCRQWRNNVDLWRKRASSVLNLDTNSFTDFTTSFFQTEFQMKYLFGAKGAFVDSFERYPKFEKLLSLMVEKCEIDTV